MDSDKPRTPHTRDDILGAVAFAAREFLRSTEWREAVPDALRHLGEAAAASRCYLYEHRLVDGVPTQTLSAEWSAPGIRPTVNDPDVFEEPYRPFEMRWVEILARGGVVAGPISSFPPEERDALLHEEDILSTAFVPVFVHGDWWGYLGFDDCESEREWSPSEVDALRTAAEILGAGIERSHLEHRLREDIAARQEAETQLSQAEIRFQTLVEHGTAIVYIDEVEEPGNTIYISPQVKDVFGWGPEELLRDQDLWMNSIHQDDRERILVMERQETDGVFNAEYRIINRAGETVWLHEQGALAKDPDGSPLYWLGIALDVTEQVVAAEKAREAEQRFRILVESSSAVTLITAPREPWETLYVSPQAKDLYGYSSKEILQNPNPWKELLLHPEDRDRVMSLGRDTDATGEPFVAEYRILDAHGETKWVHEESNLVRDQEGTPLYWLSVQLDITESKRAELLEGQLELEQAASAKLKALDQAKDDLLIAVSHDFRSPLSNIVGFGLTLQRSLPTLEQEDVLDFVSRIVENAWKLERLVGDVLDVSRLREGLLEINKHDADLGRLVRDTAAHMSLAEGYELHVEGESVVLAVDGQLVERVIDNLIMNAVRHNPTGVNIRVGARSVTGGAEIWVSDDGEGVPTELGEDLFDAFTSGQDPRNDPSPGLGLGLSIVKQITDLHGGRVWHEVTPGGGATFRVFLPEESR